MSILRSVEFLIFFPFVMALIISFMKKASNVRSAVIVAGGFVIMAVAIYTFVQTLLAGAHAGQNYLTETPVANAVIMAGEVFLFILVTVLSIKYQKFYCILLSAAGTFPILWMDLTGRGMEGATHLRVDTLSAIMILIVGFVGVLICMYAVGYMKDFHHHHLNVKDRSGYFLSLLFVFLGAMFGLVTSDSLTWIFFFWEITSVVSFLLIGYTRAPEAVNNSFRALWMNLLGGVSFSVGILFCTFALKVGNLSELTSLDASAKFVLAPVTFFAFAALIKSAQLPFSRWLLGAMVAPTPSSALLHSATMVKVGVYMLLRLAPLMTGNLTGVMVTVIGGFTFFAASLLAISQSDGKKVLAYSTISNLGLITACAGVGRPEATWAGVMLMLFHAVSKSLLFQTVGDIENCMGSRDIEDMHGLLIKLPRLAFIMIIGISGMFMAPFGMLVAKWAALRSFVDSGAVWLILFLVYGSGSTLFYWAKWLGKIVTVIHQSDDIEDITHKSEYISLAPLTTMVIVMCFAFPWISNHMIQPVMEETFNGTIPNVIGGSDVIIMMLMLLLQFLIPIGCRLLSIGKSNKMTMSYVGGINAGDDRNYIDAFGRPRPLYMTNWYMEDYFGEKKLLLPCILLSAIAVTVTLILGVGFAL